MDSKQDYIHVLLVDCMEEINEANIHVSCRNRTEFTEFVNYPSDTLFNEDIKNKLVKINVVSVFCDGSIDAAVIEKDCVTSHLLIQRTSHHHKFLFFS